MGKSHVVLTVPHAVGSASREEHDRDFVAPQMADLIAESLRGPSCALIVGDVGRSVLDLNRCVSRNSPFRHRVRDAVDRARVLGCVPIVLDVHSFPPEHHKFSLYSICVLSPDGKRPCARGLFRHLKNAGFSVGLYEHEIADIILEMGHLGTDGVLVEFAEAENSGVRWSIARSVAEFFESFQ